MTERTLTAVCLLHIAHRHIVANVDGTMHASSSVERRKQCKQHSGAGMPLLSPATHGQFVFMHACLDTYRPHIAADLACKVAHYEYLGVLHGHERNGDLRPHLVILRSARM